MDSTANKNTKKFGYHMVSQIKKPINVPKEKNKEPLSEIYLIYIFRIFFQKLL